MVYGTGSCPFFCIYEKTPGQKAPGCSAVSAGADALSADFEAHARYLYTFVPILCSLRQKESII